MKILAFTMWQNDLVGLDLWLKYYRKQFDEVFIICFGTNPNYFPELEKRNLKYITFGANLEEPQTANQMLREKQNEFLKDYDWVLYCNLDEFLIPNPRKYKNIKDLIRHTKKDWIASECFEVIHVEGEPPIEFSKPYLKQRKFWVKNPNMNKILLSRVPLSWNNGQHQIDGIEAETSKGYHNTGLYLIHIKHADPNPYQPRDFGPMKRSPDGWTTDRSKDSRIKIPEIFKNKI